MYKAYFSNSLEKMIEDYSSIFIPKDLFDRDSVFIIQNRNMEEWLKLKLAEKTGVFAGINFQFQDETLRNIISLSPEASEELKSRKTIYLDDLKLIVFHTLKNIFENIRDYPEFSSLKSYVNQEYPLSESEMNNIKSSRLYRLSDSIAGLFHHYGLNSPDMVKAWERKMSYAAGTEFSFLEGNEKWQMRLWDIIFGEESSYLHPGQIIDRILEGRYTLPVIEKRIIIFGSSFLSEQAVEFFYHLSLNCGSEIHHFILSPSPSVLKKDGEKSLILSQWGNIVTGLAELLMEKEIIMEENYKVPEGDTKPAGYKVPEGDTMPAGYKVPEGDTMPACDKMPAGYIAPEEDTLPERGLIPEGKKGDEKSDDKKNGTGSAGLSDSGPSVINSPVEGISFLDSVKASVFNNSASCRGPFKKNDSSLRIISVPGKKREIEILKNNIINLIETEGYSFYEIGVAAPDINSYVPYIDSIFRSSDPALDIPYNLMDVAFVEESDYLNGFFALLDLSGARFSRKELFRLFHNRCFMNRFRLSDSDIVKWLDICDELFIKWGYDQSHREDIINTRSDFATWRKALERISSGFLFNDNEGGVNFSSGSEILPFHLSGSFEERTVARLFYIVDQLYEKLYKLRYSELEIPAWAVRMESLSDIFLSPVYGTGDDNDRKYLKNVFRQINTLVIENLEADSLSEKPVPYSLYRTLVEEFAGKSGYCRGQYLAEGISFSSMKPLRAIPFKVIFLLGMDENIFPGREKSRNYDLRSLTPKSIDLTIQNTDCFTFLETILSSEEKLFISYTGTDIVTGETLEPSPLVAEIVSMFEEEESRKFTVKHPLHSYNEIYFNSDAPADIGAAEIGSISEKSDPSFRDFVSYDSLYFRAVSEFCKGKKKTPPLLSLDTGYGLPENPEAEISFYRIEKYLKSPVGFFLEYVEGISNTENRIAENDETEDFGLSYSDSNNLRSEITESSGNDEEIFSFYINEGKLAGTLNNSSVSEYECQLSSDDFNQFRNNLKAGGFFESEISEILLSEKGLKGESCLTVYPPVSIKAENGTVVINGMIRGLRRRGSSWFCISYGKDRIKSLISPFLKYLLLRKITGSSDIIMAVFDTGGRLSAVIDDNDYDIDRILEAVAFSYIKSFYSPVTADLSCISELVKNKNRIGNIDDFFNAADEYYSVNSFSDLSFPYRGSDIVLNYKRDDFYSLFKYFYSCLDFRKKRG